MQDQYDDIGTILSRYPEITLEEDAILKEWIAQSENNLRIFEQLSPPGYLVNKLQRFEQIQEGKQRRWLRVLDTINANAQNEAKSNGGKFLWLRKGQIYVAAASVIGIIAVLFFYLVQTNKAKNATVVPPAISKTTDVMPGQYRAKLTLDDGTTIVLDTARNGKLVQQGATSVVNENGRLVYYNGGETKKVLYNTLSTAKAEMYATVLSDGTKVWLNAQSSIHYPVMFGGDERRVEVTGEAYFEVAPSTAMLSNGKMGKRKFIVEVNGMEVEVLGTHFNINSYAEEEAIKTTLLEGKVKVHSAGSNSEAVLQPGDQAVLLRAKNENISVVKDVDVSAEIAWRFGYFNFSNADLKTVMRQLERWYDVQVVYEGTVDNEFTGKIPRELSLLQVLSVLEKQNVHFKVMGKKIIVTQ